MDSSSSSSSPEDLPCSQQIQHFQSPPLESDHKRAFDASASDVSPPTSGTSAPIQEEPQGEQPAQKRQRIEFIQYDDGSASDDGSSDVSSTDSQQQQDGENSEAEASNPQSKGWSLMTMKVYFNGELYSIFDHSIHDYLYHADRDADKGFKIEYEQLHEDDDSHDNKGKTRKTEEKSYDFVIKYDYNSFRWEYPDDSAPSP
ncbi:hypothetical protein GGR55DRAFT_703738 [Xylaria sp. FL0064]|nr:hypothetical protein GGR55DRAFT_703738 [Xylaria sp. FL0064]